MNDIFLGNALFFIIAFAWIVYLTQEMFITGSSIFQLIVAKTEDEKKQIQYASGLHWDGIEVWLLAALTMTLGVFPSTHAMTFTHLYVIIFLLLYAIITRGVVIETIHKLDSAKWKKYNGIAWAISSGLIILLFGMYLTNLFLGLPIDQNGMTGSFMSIFTTTNLAGGLFFLSLAFTSGAAWIKMTTEGDLGDKALNVVKKTFINILVPVLLLLIFMGFNVHDRLFVGTLFTQYPILFILPAVTVIFALLVLFYGYKTDSKKVFIFSMLTLAFYLITGFVGSFPDALASSIDPSYSISISDALTQTLGATVIFFVSVIFFPIVIGYQSWKYRRFKDKVKKDFE